MKFPIHLTGNQDLLDAADFLQCRFDLIRHQCQRSISVFSTDIDDNDWNQNPHRDIFNRRLQYSIRQVFFSVQNMKANFIEQGIVITVIDQLDGNIGMLGLGR